MASDKSKKSLELQHAAKEFVMLAHKYDAKKHVLEPVKKQKSIKNWIASPKIDGVRARFIDGKLFSRTQKEFSAPPEFIQIITKVFGTKRHLDGELIHLNGNFNDTISIVRTSDTDKVKFKGGWDQIVYNVFDEVNMELPFDHRYSWLEEVFTKKTPKVMNLEIVKSLGSIKQEDDIQTYLANCINSGYEGLMLRNPASLYEFGRSHNLLKVKTFQDTEVEVIEHRPGEGRHQGRLGALVCKGKNTRGEYTVDVGTGFTDEQRDNPPHIGSIITIRFFEYTDANVPRFPTFIGIRDYE